MSGGQQEPPFRSDARTLGVYEAEATELARQYRSTPSPLARHAHLAFPPGAKVLDVGAGVGREVLHLVGERFDAYGVEPSSALRALALERLPPERVLAGALPGLSIDGTYDGLVCLAVLQHLPRSQLFDAVLDLRRAVRTGGRALVSVPASPRPGLDPEGRDERGRLFNGVTPAEFQLLFERVGFSTLARWEDADALGRPGVAWTTFLFEAAAAAGTRPIDQLATVLGSRERKVATYKLALLRALTDIATTQAQQARWRPDGGVEVPLDAIAGWWIRYYWPLFEARTFLPQMNGEQEQQRHLLGFSSELDELRQHYARRGRLTAFLEDDREKDGEARRRHQRLLVALRRTIVQGPVRYAGGALASGALFRHDRATGQVLVPGALWRELSLLGHWIGDALLLRWAELTERLSQRQVTSAQALEALLVRADPERDTSPVRELFSGGARCVWTDRRLDRAGLEIDHVLPWSLWRNNDLWNLVPAARWVNNEKSDRLPERQFLRGRRDAFLEAWATTSAAHPQRFGREAEAQLGSSFTAPGGLVDLFETVVESVERTRLQRGLEAWVPRRMG